MDGLMTTLHNHLNHMTMLWNINQIAEIPVLNIITQSFIQSRSIITDYHWLAHWKMYSKFVLPNGLLNWVEK